MNKKEQFCQKEKRLRYFITLLALLFLCFLPLSLNAADRNINYEDVDLATLRIFTYTEYFAERFGLPAPDKDNLPLDGIEAIEFTLEKPSPKNKVASQYFSMLRIYLKNNINIELPGDCDFGDSELIAPDNHFFASRREKIMRWSADDRVAFGTPGHKYHMSAFYTTPDYIKSQKKGFMETLMYVEYYKNLVSGVSYIKLDTGLYGLASPSRWPIVLGLKRKGGAKYTNVKRAQSGFDFSEFYIFRLPKPFYQEMYKATQVAIKKNKKTKYWKK
ncbi:MAG: hypothetical protein KAJ62_07255 [Desulfobacteraceae bacterium]|nr:hypothetical protein [Desulfobacteraceae bacterium]